MTNVGLIVCWNTHAWITSHPGGPKRWLSFYIFAMQAFGADTLILIGGPKIEHGYDVIYKQYSTVKEALKDYPDFKVVSLSAKAKKTLQEYKHPKNKVLYLVGYDYGDIPDVPGDKLKIENYTNSTVLWSQNCVAILLYDRYIKNGAN